MQIIHICLRIRFGRRWERAEATHLLHRTSPSFPRTTKGRGRRYPLHLPRRWNSWRWIARGLEPLRRDFTRDEAYWPWVSVAENYQYFPFLTFEHRFSLVKHPKLLKICRERDIMVEVCPISYAITPILWTLYSPILVRNEVLVSYF